MSEVRTYPVGKYKTGPGARAWKGDNIGYRGAHARVYRSKGRANQYDCVDCGDRSRDWSYNFGDEPKWQVVEGKLLPYSPDPNQYVPRCLSCHTIFDNTRNLVGAP